MVNSSVIPILLDDIRPFGNKYYKLKYNLVEAKRKGYTRVITVGGLGQTVYMH